MRWLVEIPAQPVQPEWRRWWAWRPVVIDGDTMVWLEWVERRKTRDLARIADGWPVLQTEPPFWEYRLPVELKIVARGDPDMPSANRGGDAF